MGDDLKLFDRIISDFEKELSVSFEDSLEIGRCLDMINRDTPQLDKKTEPKPSQTNLLSVINRLYNLLDQQRETNLINGRNISRLRELV